MSLKTSLAGAATAIGLAALAYPAQAALYDFTYTHGGVGATTPIVVTGTVSTPLNNVPTVTGLTYNGNPLAGWIVLSSYSDYAGAAVSVNPTIDPTSPYLGTDIVFANDLGASEVITIGPAGGGVGAPLVFTSSGLAPGFGPNTNGLEEAFNVAGFTITQQSTSVPEPGAVVALLGLGLGALASKIRKQA